MTLCVGARISADLIAITNETELFGEPAHAFRSGGGSVANFRSKLSLVRRRRHRQCAPNGTGKRGSKNEDVGSPKREQCDSDCNHCGVFRHLEYLARPPKAATSDCRNLK